MRNEIKIFGVVGEDVVASEIKAQIDGMDQSLPLDVRICSEGGSVMDGIVLYDAFKAYAGPKRAVIESAAFSIASYIAMAFDDVEITENGYLMIHNPYMDTVGDDAAHAHTAEVLGKLKHSMVQAYCSKTGKSSDEILAVMNHETWINAKDALAHGYVNRISAPKTVAMKAVAKSTKLPQGVLRSLCGDRSDDGETRETTKGKPMSNAKPVAATLKEIRAAYPKASSDFIVRCLEKEMPVASVITEALATLEEENAALKAQIAQLQGGSPEEEVVASESEVVASEDEEELPVAQESEDEKPAAKAHVAPKPAARGVKPVAKSKGVSRMSAKAEWTKQIQAKVSAGIPRAKAIRAVDEEFPGLRERMIDEVNA